MRSSDVWPRLKLIALRTSFRTAALYFSSTDWLTLSCLLFVAYGTSRSLGSSPHGRLPMVQWALEKIAVFERKRKASRDMEVGRPFIGDCQAQPSPVQGTTHHSLIPRPCYPAPLDLRILSCWFYLRWPTMYSSSLAPWESCNPSEKSEFNYGNYFMVLTSDMQS